MPTKITGFCVLLLMAVSAKCLSTEIISHIVKIQLEWKVLGSSDMDTNCLDLFHLSFTFLQNKQHNAFVCFSQ